MRNGYVSAAKTHEFMERLKLFDALKFACVVSERFSRNVTIHTKRTAFRKTEFEYLTFARPSGRNTGTLMTQSTASSCRINSRTTYHMHSICDRSSF